MNGQFISQDPVFLDIGLNTNEGKVVMRNPQAMNSYSYAQNSPLVLKDPSGRSAAAIGGLEGLAALSALVAPEVVVPVVAAVAIVTTGIVLYENGKQIWMGPVQTINLPPPPIDPLDPGGPPNFKGPKWKQAIIWTTIGIGGLEGVLENYPKGGNSNSTKQSNTTNSTNSTAKSPTYNQPSPYQNNHPTNNDAAYSLIKQAEKAIANKDYGAAKKYLKNASKALNGK